MLLQKIRHICEIYLTLKAIEERKNQIMFGQKTLHLVINTFYL